MEEKQPKHIIDTLFVIALFSLFALSAIFLITIGANIYGRTVNNMEVLTLDRSGIYFLRIAGEGRATIKRVIVR